MTAGLEVICSVLFYRGQLKPGAGTTLDDETREMTRRWQAETRSVHPSLVPEPHGQAYPILINIAGESEPEALGGTSHINMYNVSFVMDHIVWLVETGIAQTDQIDIATPYAAQASIYLDLFRKLEKPKFQ